VGIWVVAAVAAIHSHIIDSRAWACGRDKSSCTAGATLTNPDETPSRLVTAMEEKSVMKLKSVPKSETDGNSVLIPSAF
jgi:hypothetical protein